MLFFLLTLACVENNLHLIGDDDDSEFESPIEAGMEQEDAEEDKSEDDRPETEPSDEPSDETSWDEPEEEEEEQSQPGMSPDNPRAPHSGDVLINELMINPEAVLDKHGEWIELYNPTDAWLSLEGLRLADQGVDDIEIQAASQGGLKVAPHGFFLICADDNFWNNGGGDCDATFHYQTFGGGFGLANGADEVVLLTPNYHVLDFFSYSEGFAPEGSSMGVDPDDLSYSGNDNTENWCDQFGFLPQGDSGSPNQRNDWCF